MLEIELKVRVTDLTPVRTRLADLGATMTERTREHDVYYNAPHRDFGSTDEALRVRYSDGRTIMTYKGAKRPDFKFKAREELNVTIEDGEIFEQVLIRLGFRKTAVVEKRREYYRYENASIALDDVQGLGSFVEIELAGAETAENAERIIKLIAEKIGVKGEHILSSYLELLLSTR
jgi:adenylate cyclase class 2